MSIRASHRWYGVTLVAAVTMVALVSRTLAMRAQQPTSSGSTEAIWITATVVDKEGRLVTNLTKDDFEIRDNGVARDITAFRNDAIPFAIAIMIDLSSSMAANASTVRRSITELIGRFEPGDRAIIGGFDALPWIAPRFSGNAKSLTQGLAVLLGGTAPLCSGEWTDQAKLIDVGGGNRGMGAVPAFGRRLLNHQGTAAWDGLACGINAVASDGETPRRVVLLVTDGLDNASGSTLADVIGDANAAGVMVYAVGMFGSEGVDAAGLRAISAQTGGGYYYLTSLDDLVSAFSHIADELRHQYVLGFSSDGMHVKHDLSVRARRPDTTTRSRRVYLETPPETLRSIAGRTPPRAPTLSAPLPATLTLPPASGSGSLVVPPTRSASTVRSPIWATFDQFMAGDWQPGTAPRLSLAQLGATFADLRREGPAWVRAADEADQPRRRLSVASFVLDLLYSQNDPYAWGDNQPASDLLEWAGNALRSGPPQPAERLWYLAGTALLERAGAANALDRLITHAMSRFPSEERWVLARAISQDLRTWPEPRDLHPFSVDPGLATAIKTRYEDAAALASVRDEALVRFGYFELRRGQIDAALAHLRQVGTPDDVYVRYWLHLFQGRALERANRLPDAIASYRQAFEDVPYAPSVTAALGAALVTVHRDTEAARLAARAMTMPPPEDPWTTFGVPDARFWPALTEALRRIITP